MRFPWLTLLMLWPSVAVSASCSGDDDLEVFACAFQKGGGVALCERSDSRLRFMMVETDGADVVLTTRVAEVEVMPPRVAGEKRIGVWEEGWLHEIAVRPGDGGTADVSTYGPAREDPMARRICKSGSERGQLLGTKPWPQG